MIETTRWNLDWIPHKEIGWTDIGEKFTRYQLLKIKWLNIYLHRVDAKQVPPYCHDHPWNFLAILLWPGYMEQINGIWHRRWPLQVLYRPAVTAHNVITPFGVSWSLVFTGPKIRQWNRELRCE